MSVTEKCKSYYITGDISSGSKVFITSNDSDGFLYFLKLVERDDMPGVNELVFDPKMDPSSKTPVGTPLIFTITEQNSFIQFKLEDGDNMKWITPVNTDNQYVADLNTKLIDIVLRNLSVEITSIYAGINYSTSTTENNNVLWKSLKAKPSSIMDGVITDADLPSISNTFLSKI